MDMRKDFGQRLKILRKYKKMSQDDVSLSTGINRSYLSDIENGKSSPTLDTVEKLAIALNVAPYEFLIFSVAEPSKTYDGETDE